jgi:hypothetical protein
MVVFMICFLFQEIGCFVMLKIYADGLMSFAR